MLPPSLLSLRLFHVGSSFTSLRALGCEWIQSLGSPCMQLLHCAASCILPEDTMKDSPSRLSKFGFVYPNRPLSATKDYFKDVLEFERRQKMPRPTKRYKDRPDGGLPEL